MATHIGLNLERQTVHRRTVVVESDGSWLIAADTPSCQYFMPEFAISRAARGAGVEPFIEKIGLAESPPTRRHARSGSDRPDRRSAAPVLDEELAPEIASHITSAEAPEFLEMHLRFRPQLGRKHKPRCRKHARIVEGAFKPFQPTLVQNHIIIREGDDVACRGAHARISRDIEARPILANIDGAGAPGHDLGPIVGRGVVNDDDLVRLKRLVWKRGEAALEIMRPIACTDDDRDAPP